LKIDFIDYESLERHYRGRRRIWAKPEMLLVEKNRVALSVGAAYRREKKNLQPFTKSIAAGGGGIGGTVGN